MRSAMLATVLIGLLAATPVLAGSSSSSSSGGPITPLNTVAEPGMLGLVGLGFIAMAVTRRRRR